PAHCRLFLVKTCTALLCTDAARSSAWLTPPAIDMCAPNNNTPIARHLLPDRQKKYKSSRKVAKAQSPHKALQKGPLCPFASLRLRGSSSILPPEFSTGRAHLWYNRLHARTVLCTPHTTRPAPCCLRLTRPRPPRRWPSMTAPVTT